MASYTTDRPSSYTTDRPPSPPFSSFVLKSLNLNNNDNDPAAGRLDLDGMPLTVPDEVGSGDGQASPVLPPSLIRPASLGSGGGSNDAPLFDTTLLSPDVIARLEQVVNSFRTVNGGANGNSSNGNTNGNLSGSAPPPPSTSSSALDDPALALEKRRHDDTKRLLTSTEARIERLLGDLEDRNGDLEGFRVDARDLKDQVEAAGLANEALRKKLAPLARLEQDLAYQVETVRAIERRLKLERDHRQAVDGDLEASRRAHAKDLQAWEVERGRVAAERLLAAQRQDELVELKQQLDAANKRVAARDRMLADAETEKRALQATVFDARHNIEETAAVFGEASLAFNTEVDRLMGTLLSMKLSTGPPRPAATAAPRLLPPTLPPTPPRR